MLITGGSKGIGFATAESFAEEGVAHLHLTSRTQEDLNVCKAELLSKFPALKVDVYALDLSNPDAVASLAEQVGWVDILVNNAGAIPSGPIARACLSPPPPPPQVLSPRVLLKI